ncbi:NAD-dependent epimerase/dehydratase [Cystobasidium minutum MCA 4210]|uniref:NAD-dependent epimerase/dehydratase n=1 Tax=Cystobasidium minutum MCA 4210 TaxID=1397322 RepID=UPI0034CE8FEF|eukprot:jgi/Rhomi1/95620/CE95619_290
MDSQADNIILITGGGGFLGSQLAKALLESNIKIKELVLSDIVSPRDIYGFENDKRITKVTSDVSKPEAVDQLFPQGKEYTAIAAFHGLMSGGSEADFEGGIRANLDSTRLMLEKIRLSKYSKPPVFLYTSSGAVYGGDIPNGVVTDNTVPAPQGSYGVQKLVCEHLCYDYSRRGWIDARIVRLPTIMVRPGAPNSALSSYASGIVREPLKGQKSVCPVSLDFGIWISSPGCVVSNFVHLLLINGDKYPNWTRTTALPGISVTTQEILDALEKVGGKKAVDLVEVKPDPAVLKIVATWPGRWETDRAFSLGCKADKDILDVVKQYKVMLDQGQG